MKDPLKELEKENKLKNSQKDNENSLEEWTVEKEFNEKEEVILSKNDDSKEIEKEEDFAYSNKENDQEILSDEELEKKIKNERKKQDRLILFVHFTSIIILVIIVILCFNILNNRIIELNIRVFEIEKKSEWMINYFENQLDLNKEIKEFMRDSSLEFDRMDQVQKKIEWINKLNWKIFEAFQEYNSWK